MEVDREGVIAGRRSGKQGRYRGEGVHAVSRSLFGEDVQDCAAAWKKDPLSGVIGA